MKKQDYSTSFKADSSQAETFKSITNVSKWWTENVEGSSQNVNDVFTVHFGQTNITLEVAESVSGKKISWNVIDCNKHWLKNKKEWKGTRITWEISAEGNATIVSFNHLGLVPGLECYAVCEDAWSDYLHNSLLKLIESGKGQPTSI